MKLIDAAESAYSSANKYFLLMWTVVALAGLTTYFEVREIQKARSEANRVIGIYKDLINPAAKVATSLTRVVVSGNNFDDTNKALGVLRANAYRAEVVLERLRKAIKDRDDLENSERAALNEPILTLRALLSFNDASLALQDHPVIEGPGLLLASQEVGSIGVADRVVDLRIKDAARLLWLSSIPMNDIVSAERRLLRLAASEKKEERARLADVLDGFAERASDWTERERAATLWTAVHATFNDDRNSDLERASIELMRLEQPAVAVLDARKALVLAGARETGGQVDVKLPGFSLPLRLADVLIYLPAFITVVMLAIYIYTARGLRYGTQDNLCAEKASHSIVGKMPVYFIWYGESHWPGWIFAAGALILPLVLTVLMTLVFLPVILDPFWAKVVFGCGVLLAFIAYLKVLWQFPDMEERIEAGVSVKNNPTA